MSISPDFSETGRFQGRKTVRAPEKSNFSQTCSLLSQYLKENGGFGDLSLGINCNLESKGKSEVFRQTATTMNLLPNMEVSGDVFSGSRNVKSMDLFPQHSGFGPSGSTEEVPKKTDFRSAADPETAPMTIFYAGKVLVFDNFPADKAEEVMLLARKAGSQNSNVFASTAGNDNKISTGTVISGSNLISVSDRPPRPLQANASDLPIARKASLHRFLEKRKDRITARAPYQVNNSASADTKFSESKTEWLGLAAKPFELQL